MDPKIGELAALGTAISWTAASLIFEIALRRISVLAANILKLVSGFCLLALAGLALRGLPFPSDAPATTWLMLSIGGLLGFSIGDMFLLNSYKLIGARTAMLILSASPPIVALGSLASFGEGLRPLALLGMAVTFGGIALAVLGKGRAPKKSHDSVSPAKGDIAKSGFAKGVFAHEDYLRGIVFASIAMLLGSAGTLLSKAGLQDYSGSWTAVGATQIRVLSGCVGFVLIALFTGKMRKSIGEYRNPKGTALVLAGSIFGPFLGVGLMLFGLQNAEAGVISTITSIVPVLVIWPSYFFLKQKVKLVEVVGAFIAVLGIVMLFL